MPACSAGMRTLRPGQPPTPSPATASQRAPRSRRRARSDRTCPARTTGRPRAATSWRPRSRRSSVSRPEQSLPLEQRHDRGDDGFVVADPNARDARSCEDRPPAEVARPRQLLDIGVDLGVGPQVRGHLDPRLDGSASRTRRAPARSPRRRRSRSGGSRAWWRAREATVRPDGSKSTSSETTTRMARRCTWVAT